MRTQIAGHDWAATMLGPLDSWPASLRTVVAMMLDSPQAMVIWWGPESLQIYNDAYAPRLDRRAHRAGLGAPAALDWEHSWTSIGPEVALVLAGQPAGQYEDVLVRVERAGRVDDTYWSYSLTPVRDDAGAIGGVLVISNETTARVLAARRQETLDVLRQQVSGADDTAALDDGLAAALRFNARDLCGAELTSAHAGASVVTPASLCITAADVGVEVDLAIVFHLSPGLPLDASYRHFLEQFTLLVAAARHRIDSEARRLIVEAERDRLLLDAPVGAAVMIGDALTYRLVNAMYAMVSGRRAEAMVGRPFTDVFPELIGSPVHDKFLDVYRQGEPFISQPTLVQIHRHGGALDNRYFTYNLSPLRTLAGEVYGLMVIAVDITVEVDARAEVEQLNTDLQAAARAKDEFLALLGHELRNPLAPIVTALELMRMRDRSSEREQVIIRRQVRHLTRLVDDLLDVSRITRGKVELRKENLDAQDVLARAVEMVMPSIEQKHQHLRLAVTPVRWRGDPARLAQIVSNLLTNASRYSEQGATIALLAGAVDGALEIEVSDNGMGIPPELLPRIFEPFVQGERQLRSAVGGLGVGLALVKNLAEMHGGSVTVRSDGLDQGSTFIVRLPIDLAGDIPGPVPASAGDGGPQSRRRVLLVDDNTDAADTLADILRLHGHDVVLAYTPEAALDMMARQPFEVAILDIGLPGMTGYELAGLMRAQQEAAGATGADSLRYIALTGFGQEIDKARSTAAQFAGHLVKPVDINALLALL
jgi:PAS domain S-box-containing protein